MGYSPWGRKESDGTEITEHARTHILLHVKAAYALVPAVQKGLQRAACSSEKAEAQPALGGS